jgi:hypothetical protein
MEGIDSSLQIEPFDPTFHVPIQSSITKEDNIDDVKINFTKSNDDTKGFLLSLSPLIIDYGEITPTNPILRTSAIEVINTAVTTYTVFSRENHPLRTVNRAEIPDTTCDNGTCSELNASPWTNTLSFGFGYRCDNLNGNDCDGKFEPENIFKQFADSSRNKTWTGIMHGTSSSMPKQTQITYKVNTAASQANGVYTNSISYILIPGY